MLPTPHVRGKDIFMTPETVKVVRKSDGATAVINKEDFDKEADAYELVAAETAASEPAAPAAVASDDADDKDEAASTPAASDPAAAPATEPATQQ